MKSWSGKRYWVIGASDGLGAALAHVLSRSGVCLVLSARSEDRLTELSDSLPGPSEVQVMDVRDQNSVLAASQAIGEIDGVIFAAGVYWPMNAQKWQASEANQMADVNFTGLVRVLGTVIPSMVAKDAGHVVIVGSLSGFRGLPGAIGYGASKAAVMSLAESMHADLRKTGIVVQLVNPGFIRTRLTDKNDFTMPFIMEPEKAAQVVFEHMNTDRFSMSFPAAFSRLFRLAQFLPDWIYYRLFRSG